jgi:hypothetical protein
MLGWRESGVWSFQRSTLGHDDPGGSLGRAGARMNWRLSVGRDQASGWTTTLQCRDGTDGVDGGDGCRGAEVNHESTSQSRR